MSKPPLKLKAGKAREHEDLDPKRTNSLSERELNELEKKLNYTFTDRELFRLALTHRSAYAKGEKGDYERLEFLGDAVLDLAVADLLLKNHQTAKEGELSKMRAALVNTVTLAEIARELKLSKYIILSRGEAAHGGHERASILADVVESLIGAIYRESGFSSALEKIQLLFGARITEVAPTDPKTELQEVLHAVGSEPPKYLLELVEGPEHAPVFVSVVEINGAVVGRGKGATKKASQQEAASLALEHLRESSKLNQLVSQAPEDKLRDGNGDL